MKNLITQKWTSDSKLNYGHSWKCVSPFEKNDETSIDTRKEWYGWMQDL